VLLHLHDGPVAAIDLDGRIPRIHHFRREGSPFVRELDRHDAPRVRDRFLPERDDAVLDGNEVAVAQVPGRAVAARSLVVVGVELDEAFAALAQQRERQQPHLGLELLLHVGDDRRAILVHRHHPVGGAPGGAGGLVQIVPAQELDFRAELGQAVRAVGVLAGTEVVAQAEEDDGEDDRQNSGNCATGGHDNSKFGS
jgi:hypothetical protein